MALSSEHILTLQQLSGIGTKTIFKVAELVTKPINTIEELCTFWKTLKGKKLEAIGVDDIIEANNSAKRIIEASARESIGLVGYYDDTFPNILRQTINEEVLVSEHPDGMLILGYKGKEVVNVAVTQSVSTIKKVRVVTLTTLFMVIIFLLVLSLVLAARSWREVKTIMSGIETLSEGKSVCLKEKGEFAAIASAINRTSDRLKKYSEYRKRWIAGVSHDIRTPLTVILGRADQIGASDIKVQATRNLV